jgi:hypothetical protein
MVKRYEMRMFRMWLYAGVPEQWPGRASVISNR